jgi:hypothetical protein
MNIEGYFKDQVKGEPINVQLKHKLIINNLENIFFIEIYCYEENIPSIQRFSNSNIRLYIVDDKIVYTREKTDIEKISDYNNFKKELDLWEKKKQECEDLSTFVESKPINLESFDYTKSYDIPVYNNDTNILKNIESLTETIIADVIDEEYPSIKNYIL